MEKRREADNSAAGRELVITRLLNAPRELVWEVFTNPEHIKNWWGPNGFTNTIDKMEVKPGGMWEFVMHGPDGADFRNVHVFKELKKPERIVLEHTTNPKFVITATFAGQGDKTLLTWHMLFESEEQLKQVIETFKADIGAQQNVDKLEAYLAAHYNGPGLPAPLVITRIINAPREIVFKAWTDPKQVEQWWSPQQFTNVVHQWNAIPGGEILVDMKGPDGVAHPMGGRFKEVDAPNKLVFTATAFAGADGTPQLQNLNTVTFEDLNGKTKLTLYVDVQKAGPGTEIPLGGMEEGWSQSLDRFGALLVSEPLVIERTFNAPAEKIWHALTNKEAMKEWYFDVSDFKPEVGFEFTFTKEKDNEVFVHLFKVTEVIAGKKISYTWRYKDRKGSSLVTFELFTQGSKTRLRVTHEGLSTFAGPPALEHQNFVLGWTQLIGTSLKKYLS